MAIPRATCISGVSAAPGTPPLTLPGSVHAAEGQKLLLEHSPPALTGTLFPHVPDTRVLLDYPRNLKCRKLLRTCRHSPAGVKLQPGAEW